MRMRLPDLLTTRPARGDDHDDLADLPDRSTRRCAVVVVALVIGAALLAGTLRVEEGSGGFIALGLAAAAVWVLGAFASGPIPLRPARPRALKTVVGPAAAIGVATFVVFLAARLIGDHLPVISGALDRILATADAGSLWVVLLVALVNGAAEELFFRGAVQAAIGPRAIAVSTVVYVVVTIATGNVTLVIAAAVMGTIFALERRASRGVLAPTVTHLVWSTLMILLLPR
jgi:membrane protease YdiL (CAAX protease family)